MKRSFIRHRSMYRIKARVRVALIHVAAVLGGRWGGRTNFPPVLCVGLAHRTKAFPRPPETLGEYDAFLLRCEIEDLQDEIERRVDKRKRKLAT
jgi:hypothetical protein